MLRSSRPRSTTIPVTASGVPRTVTSVRKEWPWISSLSAPKVVPDSACAASNRNDFVNSHMSFNNPVLSDANSSDADSPDPDRLVRLHAEPPLRMLQAIGDGARGVRDDVRAVHRLQREAFEGEA